MPSIVRLIRSKSKTRRENKPLIPHQKRAKIPKMKRSEPAVLHHYVEIAMRRNRIQGWFEKQNAEIIGTTQGTRTVSSSKWNKSLENLRLRRDKRVAELVFDIAGIKSKTKRASLWDLVRNAQKKKGNISATPAIFMKPFVELMAEQGVDAKTRTRLTNAVADLANSKKILNK